MGREGKGREEGREGRREGGREGGRQRGRQAGRQTDRQTDRQRYIPYIDKLCFMMLQFLLSEERIMWDESGVNYQ